MAGLKVVPVKVLPDGSLDLVDLREKAEKYRKDLAAFMVIVSLCSRSYAKFPRSPTRPLLVYSKMESKMFAHLPTLSSKTNIIPQGMSNRS
jgi:hypothetical protein